MDQARLQGDAKLQLKQPKILQGMGSLSIVLYHCNNIILLVVLIIFEEAVHSYEGFTLTLETNCIKRKFVLQPL